MRADIDPQIFDSSTRTRVGFPPLCLDPLCVPAPAPPRSSLDAGGGMLYAGSIAPLNAPVSGRGTPFRLRFLLFYGILTNWSGGYGGWLLAAGWSDCMDVTCDPSRTAAARRERQPRTARLMSYGICSCPSFSTTTVDRQYGLGVELGQEASSYRHELMPIHR